MQISTYRELYIDNTVCIYCSKLEFLKYVLLIRKHLRNISNHDRYRMIIQISKDIKADKNEYRIYIPVCEDSKKTNQAETKEPLFLDTAARFRFEGSISELERELEDVREFLIHQKLQVITDPYCCVLQFDEECKFLIMDVFIGTKDII